MSLSADPTQHVDVVPRKQAGTDARQEQPASATPETVNTVAPVQEIVVPDRGWPKFWYWVKRRFNKDATPPKINQAQRQEIERQAQALLDAEAVAARVAAEAEAEAARVKTKELSIERLRDLTDEKPNLTVAFIGVKGAAGTTTTMINATSTVADITRTLVYACDFNPASGSAAVRLGKNYDETMTLNQFSELVEEIEAHVNKAKLQFLAPGSEMSTVELRRALDASDNRATINARLRPTKYGVRVLSADDYVLVTTETFGTTTVKMLDILAKNCDYLFVDTANDITTAASKAVLEKADVLVFTANVGIKDSLFMLYTSMQKVRQLGMEKKVKNSVVVISNVPEGADLDTYRKYLNRVNTNDQVVHYIESEDFQGPFLGVPHDPMIARDTQVELEAYAEATYQAYLNVDIAIFEQALNLEPPSSAVQPQAAPQLGYPLTQHTPAS